MWSCPQCRTKMKPAEGRCPACGFPVDQALQKIPAVHEEGTAPPAAPLAEWPEMERNRWEVRSKGVEISRGATVGGYCGLIGVPCFMILIGLLMLITGEGDPSTGLTLIIMGPMVSILAVVNGALFGFALEASYRFFQGLFRKKKYNLSIPLYRMDSHPFSEQPHIDREQQEKLVDLRAVPMSELKKEAQGEALNQAISPAGGTGPESDISVEKSPEEAGNSHVQPRRS